MEQHRRQWLQLYPPGQGWTGTGARCWLQLHQGLAQHKHSKLYFNDQIFLQKKHAQYIDKVDYCPFPNIYFLMPIRFSGICTLYIYILNLVRNYGSFSSTSTVLKINFNFVLSFSCKKIYYYILFLCDLMQTKTCA